MIDASVWYDVNAWHGRRLLLLIKTQQLAARAVGSKRIAAQEIPMTVRFSTNPDADPPPSLLDMIKQNPMKSFDEAKRELLNPQPTPPSDSAPSLADEAARLRRVGL